MIGSVEMTWFRTLAWGQPRASATFCVLPSASSRATTSGSASLIASMTLSKSTSSPPYSMLKSISVKTASAGVGIGVGAGVAAGVAGAVDAVAPADGAVLGVAGAQAARRSDATTSDDEIRARTRPPLPRRFEGGAVRAPCPLGIVGGGEGRRR